MNAPAAGPTLNVVILGDWLPFPHGMALTSRARLMALALAEARVGVRVLALQASDRPSRVQNTLVRGEHQGIPFEYACGTTVRHDSFLVRRFVAAWGWMNGARRLVQLRRQGLLDVVYLWFWTPRPTLHLLCFTALLRLLRVPVVREINETPWWQNPDAGAAQHQWSLLAGMSGAVAISAELHDWAARDRGRYRSFRIIDVPILVDVNERQPADYSTAEPLVVFAGSPGYKQTIQFIFAAMSEVWRTHPECRLAVTATYDPEHVQATWLRNEMRRRALDSRLDLIGHVSRSELLELYARARVLLIPLFDDERSKARFPTKIGEYLAAARPIVTNSVGEIPRYFSDGVDAMVCPPGDPVAYGAAIAELLSDAERAKVIGLRGRQVAETRFHYALHAQTLALGFAAIAAQGILR